MMNLLVSVLFLAQASPDDLPPLAATLDSAVKGIAGYNWRGTSIGDELFLQRLMGDLVGVAPTPAEVQAFAADPDPKKRTKKINQLVEDPRFGTFWADRFSRVFFGDLEKVRFQGLGPLGDGVEASILPAFRKWLAMRIQKDKPWTEIVTDLLDARGSTEGDAALAYKLSLYREPGMEQAFAESVARHFLGIRLTCARCHDHPFDKWRMEDYYGLAAFVAGQRAERVNGVPQIRYAEQATLDMAGLKNVKSQDIRTTSGPISPQFLFGGKSAPADDQMKTLARFMTQRSTTQFPRALANRVWGWLMGWGLLEPVDDFNLKNKALSPAVLEAMTRDLIDGGYSLRRLVRGICNTQEYQQPLTEPGDSWNFRRIAGRKFGLGPYELFVGKGTRPTFTIDVPESWASVRPRFGMGARFCFRVPDPKDKARHAQVLVFEGKDSPEPNVGQFQKSKTATAAVEGKLKFTLTEVTGVYSCRPASDGPLDYVMVSARGESPSGVVTTYRLEGPSDLVAAAREEFIAFLKSASGR